MPQLILLRPQNRIHFAFLLTTEDPSSLQSEIVIHESSQEVDIVKAFVPVKQLDLFFLFWYP